MDVEDVDWDIVFKDRYRIKTDDKGQLDKYYGLYSGWGVESIDRLDTIPRLMDMILYAEPQEIKTLMRELEDSYASSENMRYRVYSLRDSEIEAIAEKLVMFIWYESEHHWGKMFTESIPDKVFITEYLFRLIKRLKKFDNGVDYGSPADSTFITGPDFERKYTTEDIWKVLGQDDWLTDVGTRFDEFLVEEGLHPHEEDIYNHYDDMMWGKGDCPKRDGIEEKCLKATEEILDNFKRGSEEDKHHKAHYNKWSHFLGVIWNLRDGILNGNMDNFEYVFDDYGYYYKQRVGLAEYVVSGLHKTLGYNLKEFEKEVGKRV